MIATAAYITTSSGLLMLGAVSSLKKSMIFKKIMDDPVRCSNMRFKHVRVENTYDEWIPGEWKPIFAGRAMPLARYEPGYNQKTTEVLADFYKRYDDASFNIILGDGTLYNNKNLSYQECRDICMNEYNNAVKPPTGGTPTIVMYETDIIVPYIYTDDRDETYASNDLYTLAKHVSRTKIWYVWIYYALFFVVTACMINNHFKVRYMK